jgi:hypothetical protein
MTARCRSPVAANNDNDKMLRTVVLIAVLALFVSSAFAGSRKTGLVFRLQIIA